jgi:hypothetical protein
MCTDLKKKLSKKSVFYSGSIAWCTFGEFLFFLKLIRFLLRTSFNQKVTYKWAVFGGFYNMEDFKALVSINGLIKKFWEFLSKINWGQHDNHDIMISGRDLCYEEMDHSIGWRPHCYDCIRIYYMLFYWCAMVWHLYIVPSYHKIQLVLAIEQYLTRVFHWLTRVQYLGLQGNLLVIL